MNCLMTMLVSMTQRSEALIDRDPHEVAQV